MLAACDTLNIAPPQNLSVVGESPAGLWHDNVAITSIYGTTETAAHGMTIRLDRLHTDAPLGSPMPGVQAIVRNPDGSEAPDDTEGEICLGGLIADGYLNDPERTAEKFYTQNGIHYFRTGDIGVRRGREFYYLRRADLRVKIRGYCVYPEEVEEALMRSLPIMEVAVQAYPTYSGYPALCAAYTASKRIDPQAARRAAVAALPAYMVPAIFSQVESLPTGPHGKLDRNAVIPPLE
jgi:acyl-CoA synthetase (AMP-forming)/AMP-acid ligase II